MTAPYYKYSQLYNSIFGGYYSLFYMYSAYFMLVYPLIEVLNGGSLFKMAIIKITETNLMWDAITAVYLISLSTLFLNIGTPGKRSYKVMMIIYLTAFLGVSYYVVDQISMYFTDRIFIVCLGWTFCFKLISYELDARGDLANKGFIFKLKFLICPIVVYSEFAK